MKPQRFEIGQAVTPNTKDQKLEPGCPPLLFGEVYHVRKYFGPHIYNGVRAWYIELEEISGGFIYLEFMLSPVISDTELYKELESINKTKTVEVHV